MLELFIWNFFQNDLFQINLFFVEFKSREKFIKSIFRNFFRLQNICSFFVSNQYGMLFCLNIF